MRPNRVPLLALLAANAVSLSGNALSNIALPWFVLEITGSAAMTGLTAFFGTLPLVIGAFFGGTVADRIGHKRASIVADLLSGGTVALVPLLYTMNLLPFWLLLALVFCGALLDMPGETARQALLPNIAALAGTRLERVNAATATIQRGSLLVGPLLAGVLVSLWSASNVLWLNAASFVVSALLIAAGIPAVRSGAAATTGQYLHDVREGLSFLLRDPLLRTIVITGTITNFIHSPLFGVILPVFINQLYGEATRLGWLLAAFGAGAVLGGVGYGAVGYRLPRRALLIGGFGGAGIGTVVLAVLPPFPILIIAMLFIGITVGPLNPMVQTLLQERTPTKLLARVFGTLVALALLATPAGMLLAGYMLEIVGVQATMVAIAVGSVVIAGSLFFSHALHDMEPGT
jgi:MFS family permease